MGFKMFNSEIIYDVRIWILIVKIVQSYMVIRQKKKTKQNNNKNKNKNKKKTEKTKTKQKQNKTKQKKMLCCPEVEYLNIWVG